MMIKKATPKGATGRVYGTVYSGLDVGFAVAAPCFGALMDHHEAGWVFFGAALTLALGVVSAGVVGSGITRRLKTRAAGT
jgi:MFS family permease